MTFRLTRLDEDNIEVLAHAIPDLYTAEQLQKAMYEVYPGPDYEIDSE